MAAAARRKYQPEFKAQAVAAVRRSNGKIRTVARELGIHESTLRFWVRQAAGDPLPSTPAERAEIRMLRRELERLERERDILGKAVAYFSTPNSAPG